MRLYQYKQVIGNSVTVKMLQQSTANKRLPRFVVIQGSMGTGKSTCAEITGLLITCKEPQAEEPCLKCESCKANLKAFQTTGVSRNVVKKNLGLIESHKDMTDLIKEVFVLKNMDESVYIFEEIHALDSSKQTALLEEITRLDENTYVIATTTRWNKLLPELRSRALSFTFNLLTKPEAKLLFDRKAQSLGIKKVPALTEQIILRHARGVPRDIVKLVDFVAKEKPTEHEIAKFLGHVTADVFLDLFQSMRSSMFDLHRSIENALAEYPLDVLIYHMKEFVTNSMFLLEGNVTDNFSEQEVKSVRETFSVDMVDKIAKIVEKMDSYGYSEADFKLSMIKLRQLSQGKKTAHVLVENSTNALIQSGKAKDSYKEEQQVQRVVDSGNVGKVNSDWLADLFRSNSFNGGKEG